MYKRYNALLGILFIMAVQFTAAPPVSAVSDTTVAFYDNFSAGVLGDEWISGATDGNEDTIGVVGERVEATGEDNYIETQQSFTDNLVIELAVEKVGSMDMDCRDFYVELVALGKGGVIRFDTDGIDAVNAGMINTVCGNEYPIGSAGPNKGRIILIYRDAYLKFSFINNSLQTLITDEIYVGTFDATRIRIGLSGALASPRYVDSVTISSFPSTVAIPGVASFHDNFEEDTLGSQWTSGVRTGDEDTITIVDGRVQATDGGNYIETLESFTGDLLVEMDVEKVGSADMPRWDFCVELTSLRIISGGAISFDSEGVDGINIGVPATMSGDRYSMSASGVNKGKAVLSYIGSYLTFSFINDDWDTLFTIPTYVGPAGSTTVKIWLSGTPESPRYIDNVKIYSLSKSGTQTVMTMSVTPNSLPADGSSTAQVIAVVRDATGAPLTGQDVQMIVSEGSGAIGEVTDNGDGTYTATYTASDQFGTETITATVGEVSESVDISLTEAVSTDRKLIIAEVAAEPGEDVTVPINITDAMEVAGGDMVVTYDDSILTVKECKTTELSSGMNLAVNINIAGEIILAMSGMEGIESGSGALVDMIFTVIADVEAGQETLIAFKSADIYDENGENIAINTQNGKITVGSVCMKGDVTGDGDVKSNDAILITRMSAELIIPTPEQACAADVNGDGQIRSNDAIIVLRMAAGLVAPGKESIATDGGKITVALGKSYGQVDGSAIIPVEVDNANILAGGDICVTYNSAELRAVDVSSDAGMLLSSNLAEPGLVRISFANTSGLSSKTIARITFHTYTGNLSSATLKMAQLYRPDALPIDSKIVRSLAVLSEHSALLQNFPNPFNPETWIPYELAEDSFVAARIYDASGRLIRRLEIGYRSAGIYTRKDNAVYWDGKNDPGEEVSSGVYFYVLEADEFRALRKMTLKK